MTAHYEYSPQHVYEHIYLSSQRYAWQNLVGVQRGHGDVDLATTFKFDHNQYVFGFREFIIPVASIFFYNYDDDALDREIPRRDQPGQDREQAGRCIHRGEIPNRLRRRQGAGLTEESEEHA